jgi:hypothetical protein
MMTLPELMYEHTCNNKKEKGEIEPNRSEYDKPGSWKHFQQPEIYHYRFKKDYSQMPSIQSSIMYFIFVIQFVMYRVKIRETLVELE